MYDKKSNAYKDSKKKNAAILELAERLGVPVEQINTWWKGMRDRFRKLWKDHNKSGAGLPVVGVPGAEEDEQAKLTERDD